MVIADASFIIVHILYIQWFDSPHLNMFEYTMNVLPNLQAPS